MEAHVLLSGSCSSVQKHIKFNNAKNRTTRTKMRLLFFTVQISLALIGR